MRRFGATHRFSAAAAVLTALLLLPALAPAEPAVGGKVVVAASATVKRASASIRVFCNGPRACEGTLELVAKARDSAAGIVLGEASFRLDPGASKILRLQLSPGGKRLLESGKQLNARARGSGLHPHAVKLKRAAP